MTHLTTNVICIKNIILKMAGLLAETYWRKYYKQKYIIKLKCFFWLLFYKSNYCKEYRKYFDSGPLHKQGIS